MYVITSNMFYKKIMKSEYASNIHTIRMENNIKVVNKNHGGIGKKHGGNLQIEKGKEVTKSCIHTKYTQINTYTLLSRRKIKRMRK